MQLFKRERKKILEVKFTLDGKTVIGQVIHQDDCLRSAGLKDERILISCNNHEIRSWAQPGISLRTRKGKKSILFIQGFGRDGDNRLFGRTFKNIKNAEEYITIMMDFIDEINKR